MIKFGRSWEMPNANTFDIKAIGRLIQRHNKAGIISIDPFANRNTIASITNDLDPEMNCDYNMDALDFLKIFKTNSVDLVLFDPPYSSRQVSEVYKKFDKTVNMQTTQSSFWGDMKIEIGRICKPNGLVLSFGWNSCGVGINRGFELLEILLVCHGGAHNDTICTVERKNVQRLF